MVRVDPHNLMIKMELQFGMPVCSFGVIRQKCEEEPTAKFSIFS